MATIEWSADADRAMGRRIAAARSASGLTLAHVADALGVTRATVGHWETGFRAIKHHDLARLARLLRISADEILFGERVWPLAGIDPESVRDLDPIDLGRLEGMILAMADQFGMQIKRRAA